MTKRPGPSVQEILNTDTRPVGAALRENRNDFLGDEDLDRERYFSPDFYRLEADRMWSHTWQMACRVEQIPNVGDHVVYEVADKSLIVMRSAPTEIKAFFNVCLHRGRILRETGGHVSNLRCKFHGFTWRLDGKWPSKRFSKPGTCSRRIRRSFLLLAMQTRSTTSARISHIRAA